MNTPRIPGHIDKDSLKDIEPVVAIENLSFIAGSDDPIAIGTTHFVRPNEEIAVLVLDLVGVRSFKSKMEGTPGLSIVLRVAGEITIENVSEDGAVSVEKSGEIVVRGIKENTRWNVIGAQQSNIKSVNIRYSENFFKGLSKKVPKLSSWAKKVIKTNTSVKFKLPPSLESYANRIFALSKKKSCENDLLIETIATQILLTTWKMSKRESAVDAKDVKESSIATYARELIENHPTVKIRTIDIARSCNVSETSVKKLFQTEFGVTIGFYMRKRRMERAAELLEDSSISDVANILGYSSSEAFSRAFRKQFGYPPSVFSQLNCQN